MSSVVGLVLGLALGTVVGWLLGYEFGLTKAHANALRLLLIITDPADEPEPSFDEAARALGLDRDGRMSEAGDV